MDFEFVRVYTMKHRSYNRLQKLSSNLNVNSVVQSTGDLMICPNCKREYEPKLQRKHPELTITDEFPEASPIEREQLMSGICSDKCWDEWLGIEH